MMRIETHQLIVRNHRESDWKELYEYLSLPEVYEFEPGDPLTADEAKSLMIERAGGNDFLAVAQKSSGRMVGHLYFHQSEPKEFMTWELGYIFNPEFQKHGFCTEASKALCEYAFRELKAHKIVAFCNPKNIASWKVLEKLGMEREGCFKKKAFFRKDEVGNPLWHDCYAYGKLNPHG